MKGPFSGARFAARTEAEPADGPHGQRGRVQAAAAIAGVRIGGASFSLRTAPY